MDDAEGQENEGAEVDAENEPGGPNEDGPPNEVGEINKAPADEPGEINEDAPTVEIGEMNESGPSGETDVENKEGPEDDLGEINEDETEEMIEETPDETIETNEGAPSDQVDTSLDHGENEFVESFPGETFPDHSADIGSDTEQFDEEFDSETFRAMDDNEGKRLKSSLKKKPKGRRYSTESTEDEMEFSLKKPSSQGLTPSESKEQERLQGMRRLQALRGSASNIDDNYDSPWFKLRTDIAYRRESNIRKSQPDWQKLVYDEIIGESTHSADSLKTRNKTDQIRVPTGEYLWSKIKTEEKSPKRRKIRDGEGMEEEEDLYSERSEECVCELGKPKYMYKKGHEKPCKVQYPTSDPCVFTDAPAFRGRMLYTEPCGKPSRKKKIPVYIPKYEVVHPPHFRHTLLLEELRRIELVRNRIHFLSPRLKVAQTEILRAAIEPLGPRQIRQYRRPFHEWVILDLDEDGYHDTAAFVRKLLKLGDNLTKASKEIKFKWENLMLRDYPKVSKELVKALVEAEEYTRKTPPQMDKSIESLLHIALYLMDISEGFYWVVEQLLLRAINASVSYKRDCSHRESLVRYVYGYLLAEKIKHFTLAMEHLEIARNLSLTKKWKIEVPQIPVTFTNLNLQATYMLCRVMMLYAKEIRPTKCIGALKLLSRALRYLGEPDLVEMQASVLLELGVSYEIIGEFRMAHVVMQRYLEIPNRSLEPPGKCSAYLEMAFCHRLLGENGIAEAYLQETLRTAKAAESRELNAVANKYVGIGYLAMGYTRKASRHFQISFKRFIELGLQNEMDYVRVVGAISKGAEIMPYIAELIKQTEDPEDESALERMIRWRMRHTKFWGDFASSPQLYEPELFNVLRTEKLIDDDEVLKGEGDDAEEDVTKATLKAMLARYKAGKFLLPDPLSDGSILHKERLKWRARTEKAPPPK